jgi:NAD(P)-dependent dehydrogenase (short-subunit alcohol dehydrogenase family)
MTAALVLDAAGARVALVARNEDQLREVAATPGNEALVFPADLGRNGGADIPVNNAGLSRPTAAVDLSMDEWDAVLNLDLRRVFALTRALAVGMLDRGYGRVVNVSSVLGLLGDAWAGPYSASKAGLNGLTRSLAAGW